MKSIIILFLSLGFINSAHSIEPILNQEERIAALDALDSFCGDTFCASDFGYDFVDLSCSCMSCVITMRAEGHSVGYPNITVRDFDRIDSDKKEGDNWKVIGAYEWSRENEDRLGIGFLVTCEILKDTKPSEDLASKIEAVYNETADCAHILNEVFWSFEDK